MRENESSNSKDVNSFMTEVAIIQKPTQCSANQWAGLCMITASVMKELIKNVCGFYKY